jgi:hypothetical protein
MMFELSSGEFMTLLSELIHPCGRPDERRSAPDRGMGRKRKGAAHKRELVLHVFSSKLPQKRHPGELTCVRQVKSVLNSLHATDAGAPYPGFPVKLVAFISLMRLSSMKAARAAVA